MKTIAAIPHLELSNYILAEAVRCLGQHVQWLTFRTSRRSIAANLVVDYNRILDQIILEALPAGAFEGLTSLRML